ncbi:hypothetical protein K0651_03550 [Ornithinimicrobium sp. Arc0846-15]|nr:hypothetical protein [Ornithinimicrobium laminariae]
MQTSPPTESHMARSAASTLRARLPESWTVTDIELDDQPGSVQLTAPDGTSATLVVAVKKSVERRDVQALSERLAELTSRMPNSQGLVSSGYLSESVRGQLSEAGLSYVDATGNLNVVVDNPAFFISQQGADADPWRGPGRPRGTLRGEPAASVVRVLTDFSGELPIRDVIALSEVSTGAVYRVIDFLESEGLLERPRRGEIFVPDWVAVLRRWSEDYSFTGNSSTSRWIAPRGLDDLVIRAAESPDFKYVTTGTLAAASWAPYAPARSAMIYVSVDEAAAHAWGLRPADAGANVLLGEPSFETPYARTLTNKTGLKIAHPAQVAVDLMSGPGRNPAEAEELITWMVNNEQSWRN